MELIEHLSSRNAADLGETSSVAVGNNETVNRPVGIQLERVVIAPAQADPAFRILALEIYSDCAFVRWIRLGPLDRIADPSESLRLGEVVAMRDDQGTEYARGGSNAGLAGTTSMRGQTLFTPQPPRNARKVVVSTSSGVSVEFTLGPATT